MYCIISDESRPSDKWGAGRHPDPEIRGPGLEKEFSRPCSPLFGPKSGGEGGGGASPGSTTYCITEFSYHWSLVLSGCPASNRGSKGKRCPDRNEEWKT